MDFRRLCGRYYKACLICIVLLVIFQYQSMKKWASLKRPRTPVILPRQGVVGASPGTLNVIDVVETVGAINDRLDVDKVIEVHLPEVYADYEMETADESDFNGTLDGNVLDASGETEDADLENENNLVNTSLIVLFTSWGYSDEKLRVHETLLRLWASWLFSSVKPLVLTNDARVSSMATAANWSVLPVTTKISSCRGPPVLRNLFLDVMQEHEALFYGYSNADIIFGNGLVKTLKFLRNKYQWSNTPVLVVGRRYNYDFINSRIHLNDSSEVRRLLKFGQLVRRSTDYFFTNIHFPWKQVPMVSIGRPFVVRAVIGFAIKNHYDIIDATRTIESVHLTTADGILASWNKPGVDCNKHLLIKGHHKLPLGVGHCECARLETVYDQRGHIKLRRRKPSRTICPGLK